MSKLASTAADCGPRPDSIELPPGVEAPRRQWRLEVAPSLEIAVHEWGEEADPPLFLAHGGADFARTFDRFAPLLASAGWRVISWDHRGHGDSDRAALYSWLADLRDALTVVETTAGSDRAVLVGHSKGGGLFSHLAAARPERFSHFINIDGIPRRHHSRSKSKPPLEERILRRDQMLAAWLDHRRRAATKERRPGSLEDLAQRRARMNPRLSMQWLRYLVTVGGTRSQDGWRWNLDPVIRMGGIGPWRPDWGLRGLRDITVPMLAILGRQREPMGWGNDPDEARADLPPSAELEIFEDSGHFVHIEHPQRVADRVLQFLGTSATSKPLLPSAGSMSPSAIATSPREQTTAAGRESVEAGGVIEQLRHGRLTLALHRLPSPSPRRPTGDTPASDALLLLPGLGETVAALRQEIWRDACLARLQHEAQAAGEVWALDWSGHGASQWAVGGGYSTEALLGDVDLALSRIGAATLCGRGLGAYVALLAQGARPRLVRGALLKDGPGLDGGGAQPLPLQIQGSLAMACPAAPACGKNTPLADSLALTELAAEVRPPGYAKLFVRQSVALSGLPRAPIRLAACLQRDSIDLPPWLAALQSVPGVVLASAPNEEPRSTASARNSGRRR